MKAKRKKVAAFGIIKSYSIIISSVIVLFVSVISVYESKNIYHQEEEKLKQAILHTANVYTEDARKVDLVGDKLAGSSEKIESIQRYFTFNEEEYFNYITEKQGSSPDYFLLPNRVQALYMEDKWLASVSFSFDQIQGIYYSTKADRSGHLLTTYKEKNQDVQFSKMILDQHSGEMIGTLSLSYDRSKYQAILNLYKGRHPMDLEIQSEIGQIQFVTKEQHIKAADVLSVSLSEGQHTFVGTVPKKSINRTIMSHLIPLWLGTVFILSILLFSLRHLFSDYQFSVKKIMETLRQVKDGKMDVRINEPLKDKELNEIASGVNQMLGHINDYVVANIQLDAMQKDASIRALQSQINPHFMYNTLEYIRMSAIGVNARELANVVFTFSRLLRNNISQETTTTVEKELEFCEKYAYLYQMRYPDCLAYHFSVSDTVKENQIPKFIVQPLLENYFIHGVDFEKVNNAGAVKAYETNGRLHIEVSDNGVGIPEEKLAEFQAGYFRTKELTEGRSIGIPNVYERLKLYYDNDFSFRFMRNEPTGTKIIIDLPLTKKVGEADV